MTPNFMLTWLSIHNSGAFHLHGGAIREQRSLGKGIGKEEPRRCGVDDGKFLSSWEGHYP
jgi:hypothetical protein